MMVLQIVLLSALGLATPSLPPPSEALLHEVAIEAATLEKNAPELAVVIAEPQGLSPKHYLKRRRPTPEVAREFERHPNAAPLMMKRYLREFIPPLTPTPGLTIVERQALRTGLLWGIGASGHRLAGKFLIEIAPAIPQTPGLVEGLHQAMVRCRQAGIDTYLLGQIHSANSPIPTRASALRNAGHLRTAAVSDAVISFLQDPRSPLFAPALNAAATHGSAWGWRAAGAPTQGTKIRKEIGQALLKLLRSAPMELLEPAAAPFETALAMVASASIKEQLKEPLPKENGSPERLKLRQRALARVNLALRSP